MRRTASRMSRKSSPSATLTSTSGGACWGFVMMASSSSGSDRLAEIFRKTGSRDRAVEMLSRQPGLDPAAKLEQRLDIDAGLEAERLEQEHAVLGIDVAARPRREGTASQPRERRIEL